MTFRIRPATFADLPQLMCIYETARRFMREHGNGEQWGNGYPSEALLADDIQQRRSFVCLTPHNEIAGTFCYVEWDEPAYGKIYHGAWLNGDPYGVIHRLASSGKERGVAQACIDWCFERCSNVRIDTHRNNKVLQNILQKAGFHYCGIIRLEDGSERLAYQKITKRATEKMSGF